MYHFFFENLLLIYYSQTCFKRPLKGNVKSGLLKRWSLKKGFGSESEVMKKQRISNNDQVFLRLLYLAVFVHVLS